MTASLFMLHFPFIILISWIQCVLEILGLKHTCCLHVACFLTWILLVQNNKLLLSLFNKLILNQLFCLHQRGGTENKPWCKRVSCYVAQPGSPSAVLCMICNTEFLNHQTLIHSAYKPVLCLSPSLPYTSRNRSGLWIPHQTIPVCPQN